MAARDPGSHFVVFTQSGKISVGYPGSHFGVFTQSGKISVGYPGSHFGVFISIRQDKRCVFFQTSYMKKMLSLCPGVLYIDSTYCLNLYGYPAVVFMSGDGDGVGHCVGYAQREPYYAGPMA